MNIILLHTHDLGRVIEPYGAGVRTPNLMALARESTLFRHCYCTAPTCSPSRAGMLTGMLPHSAGLLGLAHRGFHLKDYSKHLVRYLGDQGFETALCGIQHEAPSDKVQEWLGYEKILGPETAGGDIEGDLENARAVCRYLREPHNRPFFLSYGMASTHRVYPKNGGGDPNYVLPPFPIPDNAQTRQDTAELYQGVMAVDDCVGMVLDAIRETGREEDSIIVFTTDHGVAFPNMKCHLYDTGIGVALMLRYPGNPGKGTATDALCSHLDLFPTLCELAGLQPPPWLQGVSLCPVLEGRAGQVRDELFAEVTYHAAYEPMRCVRTRRYKYIRFFDDLDSFSPSNTDDGPSKTVFCEAGYFDRPHPRELLFDLTLDPVERVNLAEDPQLQDVLSGLRVRLQGMMEETDDPLLEAEYTDETGKKRYRRIPAPKDSIVNRQLCLSPETHDPADFE